MRVELAAAILEALLVSEVERKAYVDVDLCEVDTSNERDVVRRFDDANALERASGHQTSTVTGGIAPGDHLLLVVCERKTEISANAPPTPVFGFSAPKMLSSQRERVVDGPEVFDGVEDDRLAQRRGRVDSAAVVVAVLSALRVSWLRVERIGRLALAESRAREKRSGREDGGGTHADE